VLKKVEGVISAEASFVKGEAVVTYDPGRTSPEALAQEINSKTLYRATVDRGKN